MSLTFYLVLDTVKLDSSSGANSEDGFPVISVVSNLLL